MQPFFMNPTLTPIRICVFSHGYIFIVKNTRLDTKSMSKIRFMSLWICKPFSQRLKCRMNVLILLWIEESTCKSLVTEIFKWFHGNCRSYKEFNECVFCTYFWQIYVHARFFFTQIRVLVYQIIESGNSNIWLSKSIPMLTLRWFLP